MKVFSITGFNGHYPIGTAAIVVAKDERHACQLLSAELADQGLGTVLPTDTGLKIVQIKTHEPLAIITHNGNY